MTRDKEKGFIDGEARGEHRRQRHDGRRRRRDSNRRRHDPAAPAGEDRADVKRAAPWAKRAADVDERSPLTRFADDAAKRDHRLGKRIAEGQRGEQWHVGNPGDADAAEKHAAGQRDGAEERSLMVRVVREVRRDAQPKAVPSEQRLGLGDAGGGARCRGPA